MEWHIRAGEQQYVASSTEELKAWLRNPPKQKPMMPNNGMGMPNLNLAENEISDLISFLQTLK